MLQTLKQAHQLQQQGKLREAEKLYRFVLNREPDNLHALNLLGVLCVNSGRPEEAVTLIRRALSIQPGDSRALVNLALGLKDLGQASEARRCLKRSLSIDSDNAFALNCLGSLLLEAGKPEEAIAQYKKAVRLNPEYVDCWCNLAAAFTRLKEHEHALLAIRQALKLNARLPQAHHNLAQIYREQSRFDKAIQHYKIALQEDPDFLEAMLNLARTYREAENPEASKATLETLIARQTDNPEVFNAMGLLQEQLGDPGQAAHFFSRAISIAPDLAVSHYQLAQIKGRQILDEEITSMERLLNQKTTTDEDKSILKFALAGGYEQKGRFQDAFDAWADGNAIKAAKSPYNEEEKSRFYRSVVKSSTSALQRLSGASGLRDNRPLFILGMPRSGNTLTGQILSSHSAICSLGELSLAHDMAEKIENLTGQKYPGGLEKLSAEQCKELGQAFHFRVPAKLLDYSYVIDNTPLNFQHIGLLSLVLPGAKFIHCHRNPVDTCFSMFKIPFGDNQSYAHDLISLGKHYTSYRILMDEWKRLLPGRILDVCYEETVEYPEKQSRRMLEFLGLPFEESVLKFYQSKSLVRTPSTSQVRKPIYKDAIHAWKRYEQQLQPLIESLQVD